MTKQTVSNVLGLAATRRVWYHEFVKLQEE